MRLSLLAIITGLFVLTGCGKSGEPVQRVFGDLCAMHLAQGKEVKTDCSTNTWDEKGGLLCFKSDDDKMEFHKDLDGNLKKAKDFYAQLKK